MLAVLVLLLLTRPIICVSLKHAQRRHGETSKGKAIFSAYVFVLVLTPLIRINTRGLPAEVNAFKLIMRKIDKLTPLQC